MNLCPHEYWLNPFLIHSVNAHVVKNLNNRWFSNLNVIFFLCSKHIWSNLELLLYELSLSNHDKTLKTKLNHDGPILLIRLSFSVNLDQQRQKCSLQLWVGWIFTLLNVSFWVYIWPFYRVSFNNRQWLGVCGLSIISGKPRSCKTWCTCYGLSICPWT